MRRPDSGLESFLDGLTDRIADRVADRILERLSNSDARTRRLLTIDEAAGYTGRTKIAVQHMVADDVPPTVRHDARVFLDIRDLDRWIERAKR